MSDLGELVWFVILLMMFLWMRELSRRITALENFTMKSIDVIADRVNKDRKNFLGLEDLLLSTDYFRTMKQATDDEDFVISAIIRLRQEGRFDAALKLEEMEHQNRRGIDSRIYKNFFRGIGWVSE